MYGIHIIQNICAGSDFYNVKTKVIFSDFMFFTYNHPT